jgi:hypothetical protein
VQLNEFTGHAEFVYTLSSHLRSLCELSVAYMSVIKNQRKSSFLQALEKTTSMLEIEVAEPRHAVCVRVPTGITSVAIACSSTVAETNLHPVVHRTA